jgi:hypothetical protein
MTLLSPAWLFIGAGAALAIVALHLLAAGRPLPMPLPTARFVPARSASARRLAHRPVDVLLLAVRVAAVLLGALALARPTRAPSRRTVARVIVADRSRAARDSTAVRDSVRALAARGLAGAGDLLVAFDSIASTPVALGATAAARDSAIADALGGETRADAPAGALSAAIAAARRAAVRLRDAADSVELVIVSPLTTRETDAATDAIRGEWRGRAMVVRVAAAEATPVAVRLVTRKSGTLVDDALAAAVAVAGLAGSQVSGGGPPTSTLSPEAERRGTNRTPAGTPERSTMVRIVRDGPTAADRAWARDSAGVLVDWPVDGVPTAWARSARADTAGAVVAVEVSRRSAFVAPLPRRATWRGAGGGARVVARWADGTPAAVERGAGDGCVREVAVAVPQTGDAALRPTFRALLGALAGPCAHRAVGAPLDATALGTLAGRGPLLATASLAAPPAPRDPLARWLLGAAIALLALEVPLRLVGRRRASGDTSRESAERPSAEAAA